MPSDKPAKRIKATRVPFVSSFRLALRNAQRHAARSASVVVTVMFGCAALVLSRGFIEDVFVQLGETIVHSQSGHIQIAKGGYYAYGTQQPDKYLVADPEGDKKRIASLPDVEDVMARLSFSGLLNNGRADLPIIGEGIEPGKEAKLGTFMKIAQGRMLNDTDQFSVILGSGVAKALRIKVGDRVVLVVSTADGAMNTLDVDVVGIFQTFSKDYDARAVKIPLAAAQELLNTKGANTLVIYLKRTDRTSAIAATLTERTIWRDQEVRSWVELNDFYPKTVELYEKQFGGLQLIVLLMVVLSVANAVSSGVYERTAEFGTARALGGRGSNTFELVMLESMFLGFLGAGIGLLVSIGAAELISHIGIPMPPPPNSDLPYIARIRIEPEAMFIGFAISFGATALAAILPAWKVSRMDITDALRQRI